MDPWWELVVRTYGDRTAMRVSISPKPEAPVYISLHLSAASSPTATLFRLQTCLKSRYAASQIYITGI